MTDLERRDRAADIGDDALDLEPGAARDAFIQERCAGDLELAQYVLQYIAWSTIAEDESFGIPKAIAGYHIRRTIGSGGMGVVYEAWEEIMHRDVALKVLHPGTTFSASEESRFEREAWIGGRLNHPNIVKVFAQGAESRTRYFAMQLVQGNSLATEIRRAQTDSVCLDATYIRKMISLFVDVADALHYVHQNGILHRDIKPANLLLANDGSRLLLTDFGAARDDQYQNLTRNGDLIGTIRYMSPEQLTAQQLTIDHRSDIYSLGVSLYEALTLTFPYAGDTEEAYLAEFINKPPIPPRERNRNLSRDLETLLMKCLDRDPDRRYASAGELKQDLLRLLDNRPVLARRPGILRRVARLIGYRRVTLGNLTLCIVLVAAVFAVWSHYHPARFVSTAVVTTGHTILFDGFKNPNASGFQFATKAVVRWQGKTTLPGADLLVANPDKGPSVIFFLPNDTLPYTPKEFPAGRNPANGGILEMPGQSFEGLRVAPSSGYDIHYPTVLVTQLGKIEPIPWVPQVGRVYCIRTWDGHHFAKIKVTDIGDDRIGFDWAFQPSGSLRFD